MTATDRVLTLLGQAERAAPHRLAVLAAEAAHALGAVGSAIYVVDYGQTVLVPMSGAPDREPLPGQPALPPARTRRHRPPGSLPGCPPSAGNGITLRMARALVSSDRDDDHAAGGHRQDGPGRR